MSLALRQAEALGAAATPVTRPPGAPPEEIPKDADAGEEVEVRGPASDCAHCGLRVPPGLLRPNEDLQFCCAGCETVFQLLSGSGLRQYYSFRERLGEKGRSVQSGSGSNSEFDTPTYRKLYCEETPEGHMRTELLVEGMHCAACVWLLERLPRVCPAALESRVNLGQNSVAITWDPTQAPLSEVTASLSRLGYRARPKRGREAARLRRDELRGLLVRIGVAGASAGNVMLMAFALYSGEVGLDEAGTMTRSTARFFEILSFIVSLPALWASGIFFRGAWSALRTRTPHMDLPIALGIGVGFVWGAAGALLEMGELYFDSITTLVFLLLVGRYLQRRHQMSAGDAAELLHAVVPSEATLVVDGERRRVCFDEVNPGDWVSVASGQVVPVDGRVVQGHSSLDKSLLSGESRPIEVGPGDSAEAGSLNSGSELIVEVTSAGASTRVARLMRDVERAMSTRTKLIGQVDRIAGAFTVTVLLLAICVATYWWFVSPAAAVDHSLALLIVACPCALGMATPLALSVAVSRAAKSKKLVFSADSLENLARPIDVVIDKTGTLTEGKLSVQDDWGDASAYAGVLAAERHSTHPVSLALITFLEQRIPGGERVNLLAADVEETLGGGLVASLGQSRLVVGSPRFVKEHAHLGDSVTARLSARDDGASPVLVARDGEVCAGFWLEDALRADAATGLSRLHSWGYRLHLLSGDDPRTVARAARVLSDTSGRKNLFESVRGGVTPEEKLRMVTELSAGGRGVAMVGDGVNDAGALAAADVGIAVTGAAEVSRMSADVYLARPGIGELVELFAGARLTLVTIRRGIAFSLAYNAVGITLAAVGWIGPLMAAVLMPLSSLTVVTNAYRARTFSSEEEQ